MTQALIKINGTDGSNDNLPIATLVSLDNHGNGGELTYLWSIVDQPAGTADALSSTTIHNPSFTPNKEGTYLLQLVVNASLPDEATATAIVGVRDLKTFQRLPAARETIEDSNSVGWKTAANSALQTALNARADSNLVVCWSHNTAVLNQLVKFGGTHVIKSGLPGQETVALTAAAGTSPVIGAIVGPCVPAGPIANALVFVRTLGFFENSLTGAPAVGDPVFIDTGTSLPSLSGSTEVGRVVLSAAGSYRYALHCPPGTGGGGGGSVDIDEDGSPIVTAATLLNFTGGGVTVTDSGGGEAQIAIPGGGGGGVSVESSGTVIVDPATTLNFTGTGVSVADAGGGVATVTIGGGSGTNFDLILPADVGSGFIAGMVGYCDPVLSHRFTGSGNNDVEKDAQVIGMCTQNQTGATQHVRTGGPVKLTDVQWGNVIVEGGSLVEGIYYLGDFSTAGLITAIKPTTSGTFLTVVGFAVRESGDSATLTFIIRPQAAELIP